ncbi:NFACT RNA binding domain-containing protein [Hydrogenimonas sp. SS33]|uniref:NFACT RNA binding domain-containing protein n=1 Tax=Hydrogenimonas leucolamina TaxID=2954236 RepID=UPI00336C0A80
MKFYELEALVTYLKRFRLLKKAERIDDNVLRLEFDQKRAVGFDLSRGQSEIFDATGVRSARSYHAPFDTLLKKRFSNAKILNVSMPRGDKIIRFETQQQGAYKARRTVLQLELTGRHTNAIILDEEGNVLEALRHVDSDASYRIVKPGSPLAPLPPYNGKRSEGAIEDVEAWLEEKARKRRESRLERLKARHAKALQKKIDRLEKELRSLPDRTKLEADARTYAEQASLVLAHLHEIRPYDTRLQTQDFEGRPVTVELPPLPNPRRLGEHFYNLSKRAAAKAENLHIEQENLQSRIGFYRRLLENLRQARSEEEIHLLFPPRQQRRKKEKRAQCEIFHIGDYRVLVGRNERENVWVLKNARAGDIWLHLKDRPSSHCIIQSNGRKQIPREVLEKAAAICVETSVTQPGDYPVDYTYRRNVKITHGAHVNYVDYDTITIRKQARTES